MIPLIFQPDAMDIATTEAMVQKKDIESNLIAIDANTREYLENVSSEQEYNNSNEPLVKHRFSL